MLSRTSERTMRGVRAGLLAAWFVLFCSLFFDPLTPLLTAPDMAGSPFRVDDKTVLLQGEQLRSEPYAMGNRIFWTMVLPLLPLTLMLAGHEVWRRVCPLSFISQIPRLVGWQRTVRVMNRRSGHVDRVLALLPPQAALRRHRLSFQFGFLTAGLIGRILFYNSNPVALAASFAFIAAAALLVGLLYGGKTWCNYFCPTAVIQGIYTGPGGLFDSKAHLDRLPVTQSMCRTPGPAGDRSACVGCAVNCPDIDLENSYWKDVSSDQKRFVYYGFFGLVFAFYTYYYVYSGSWDYYMSGYWTHESGQLARLLSPGFYIAGVAIPLPKIVAAPVYFVACIAASYGLFALAERAYAGLRARHAKAPNATVLRHQMLTVSAFLSLNLFYLFAGRPNILLMPPAVVKVIDVLIVAVSVVWLVRSLKRDAGQYHRENLASTLRIQLVRLGFQSEDLLEGRSIDQLSADEVYVLAKTLPNFTLRQKREVYRAILTDALETGQTKFSESLRLLSDLRVQLGLSDADHQAAAHALGIEDPTLLNSDVVRSAEMRARQQSYREFLLDVMQQGLSAGVAPSQHLASPRAVEAIRRVQASMGISDEEHAALAAEITNDKDRLAERQRRLVDSLCGLESARFSLSCDRRPESLLIRHDLLLQQKLLIREAVSLAGSVGDPHAAGALAATIRAVAGTAAQGALDEAIEAAPAPLREILRQPMPPGAVRSYFDVIEASGAPEAVFREFAHGTDPGLAALAISALAETDPTGSRTLADELRTRTGTLPSFAEEALAAAERGRRSDTTEVMARLLSASIFSTLDLATLGEIAQRSSLVTFSSGDCICRAGESSNAMFVLAQGATVAWAEGPSGRIELRRGGEGAVFGELGVITGRPRSASIEVTSPTATVVAIPRDAVDDLLGRNLAAAQGILKVVSGYLLDDTPSAAPQRPQMPAEPMPTASENA